MTSLVDYYLVDNAFYTHKMVFPTFLSLSLSLFLFRFVAMTTTSSVQNIRQITARRPTERPIKARLSSNSDLAEKISKLQSDNDALKQRLSLIESSLSSNIIAPDIIIPDIILPNSYKRRKIFKRNNDQSVITHTKKKKYLG